MPVYKPYMIPLSWGFERKLSAPKNRLMLLIKVSFSSSHLVQGPWFVITRTLGKAPLTASLAQTVSESKYLDRDKRNLANKFVA